MARNKVSTAVLAGVVILSLVPALRADTKLVISHSTPRAGIGVWIGTRGDSPMCHPPVYRHVVIAPPWRHRFDHLGSRHVGPVIVRPPVVPVIHPPVERRVVIEHAPGIEDSTITVWITNSNGSRIAVELTRRGSWYIGPRGEYYAQMPTNEQLRVAYGFSGDPRPAWPPVLWRDATQPGGIRRSILGRVDARPQVGRHSITALHDWRDPEPSPTPRENRALHGRSYLRTEQVGLDRRHRGC